jgi:glycosyltransferase involved in cell wall biosynthesis
LRAPDVFINMAYQEALGVSCLEAMACGAPVIASNAGGLPEVLDNGKAGFLLEPGDETGLAQLINQLWQQPELMQEKSRHALQQVQKFSLSNLEQNLFDLFTVEKKGV